MKKIKRSAKGAFVSLGILILLSACDSASIDGWVINKTEDTLIMFMSSYTKAPDTILPNEDKKLHFKLRHPSVGATFTCCPCELIGDETILKPINPKKELTKSIHNYIEWKTILPPKLSRYDNQYTKCYFTINKRDIAN